MTSRPLTPRPYAHYSMELLKQQQKQFEGKDQFFESLIADELKRREIENDIKSLKKPHWTLVPIFWFTLAALLISLLAYFRPTQSDVRDVKSNALQQSSESISVSSAPTLTMPSQKLKPSLSHRKP